MATAAAISSHMGFFVDDLDDPNLDPNILLFHHAGLGSVSGMEEALKKGADIESSSKSSRWSALHFAASCSGRAGTDAVRWLLQMHVGWYRVDDRGLTEEQVAKEHGNEESSMVLREWYVQKQYEVYYMVRGGEDNPNDRNAFQNMRMDQEHENEHFCMSFVEFTRPRGAPDDEIAMVCAGGEEDGTGVMMEWERPIICETARRLLDGMPRSGLHILNIGFGIGMIDTYFQEAHPAEHVIIEAHPQCLVWMRNKGWYDRPGVRILEGRWQDFLVAPQRAAGSNAQSSNDTDDAMPIDIGKFDVVYFDTFAEGYYGHVSFIQHVPRLLRGPGSRFSFFDCRPHWLFREVATRHHNDLGMNTEWTGVQVDKKKMWKTIWKYGEGVKEEGVHHVPICALALTVPRTLVPGAGWNNQAQQLEDKCGK